MMKSGVVASMKNLWEEWGLYAFGLLLSFGVWVLRSVTTNEKRISLLEQKLDSIQPPDAEEIAKAVAKRLKEDR